ncbi:MAG: hypothetical protein WDN75_06645 [Bacteroidota bacterium]
MGNLLTAPMQRFIKQTLRWEIALPSAFFIGSFFLFKEVDKQANMTEADVLNLILNL